MRRRANEKEGKGREDAIAQTREAAHRAAGRLLDRVEQEGSPSDFSSWFINLAEYDELQDACDRLNALIHTEDE